jgi:hypothetical protein
MNLENIPNEVIEVWAYQMSKQPVGTEPYKRLQDTINKYPEHFPQEHIYNSIPNEVHIKYREESIALRLTFYPRKESDIQEGEGIYSWVRRQQPVPLKITNLDLQKLAEKVFVTAPKIKKEYETAKKKLWNKHYKKYKLKYTD